MTAPPCIQTACTMSCTSECRALVNASAAGLRAQCGITDPAPGTGDRTAQSGVDTPGCDCGHDGMGAAWHISCTWARGQNALRDQYAAALIARIKKAVVPSPSPWGGQIGSLFAATEYDLADAVLAVRDEEMEQLRARVATLEHVAAGNLRHVRAIVPELEQLTVRAEQAEATIARVRELHTPITYPHPDMPGPDAVCTGCDNATSLHPCDTIRALDQEPPPADPQQHRGGNAEDCPACATGPTLPYPFICPASEKTT